jgi:hypothetical protein
VSSKPTEEKIVLSSRWDIVHERDTMYYDRFGNITKDDQWREHDIRIVYTGGSAPVVGDTTDDEITFRTMLDDTIVKYRLRVANGWLSDVTMTHEDKKELLKD